MLGKGVEDRLAHPPHRVGDELDVAIGVEALGRLHEAEVSLVDEVEVGEAEAPVALRIGDHEAQVRLHQPLQGLLVARLDPPAQLPLFLTGEGLELRDLADVRVEAVPGGGPAGLLLFPAGPGGFLREFLIAGMGARPPDYRTVSGRAWFPSRPEEPPASRGWKPSLPEGAPPPRGSPGERGGASPAPAGTAPASLPGSRARAPG